VRNKREIYDSNISHRALSIYLYLWDRANKNGQSFPSLSRIGTDLNLSVSTVRRGLKDLEEMGYIKKNRRHRLNGGRSSNLYTILK